SILGVHGGAQLSAGPLGSLSAGSAVSHESVWKTASALFTLGAVASFGFAAWTVISARGDSEWPTIDGRVIEATFSGLLLPNPSGWRGQRGGGAIRRWHVRYEYRVAGQVYVGEASTAISAPRGIVTVYYSPTDPADSVLEPGVDLFLVFITLVLGSVSFL